MFEQTGQQTALDYGFVDHYSVRWGIKTVEVED